MAMPHTTQATSAMIAACTVASRLGTIPSCPSPGADDLEVRGIVAHCGAYSTGVNPEKKDGSPSRGKLVCVLVHDSAGAWPSDAKLEKASPRRL